MIDTMALRRALVWLPQIGVLSYYRMSVGRNAADLLVFINPVFVERDGVQLEEEGCLACQASRPRLHVPAGLSSKRLIGPALSDRRSQRSAGPRSSTKWIIRWRCFSIAFAASLRSIVKKIRKLARAGKW